MFVDMSFFNYSGETVTIRVDCDDEQLWSTNDGAYFEIKFRDRQIFKTDRAVIEADAIRYFTPASRINKESYKPIVAFIRYEVFDDITKETFFPCVTRMGIFFI